jgi:hypothetical protein
MRIAEIVEIITPHGSMSPAAYADVAQKRDLAQQKKQQSAKKAREKKQQRLQKKVWKKNRPAKPTKFRGWR